MLVFESIFTVIISGVCAYLLMREFFDYIVAPKSKLGKLEAENEHLREALVEQDLQMKYMSNLLDSCVVDEEKNDDD